MQKYILFVIATFFMLSVHARENKNFSLSFSGGYFADIRQFINPGYGNPPEGALINPKAEGQLKHGNSFALSCRYQIDSLYETGLFLSKGSARFYFNDPYALYWDEKGKNSYWDFGVTFSLKLFELSGSKLKLTLGPVMEYYINQQIDEKRYSETNRLPEVPVKLVRWWDLGVISQVEYSYCISKNLGAGINLGCFNIWQMGFESVFIQPSVIYRF